MLDHNSSRLHDMQHAQGIGEAATPAAGAPNAAQPTARSSRAQHPPIVRRPDIFDRWLDATLGLPALPPLDPPAELPPPGEQSPWPADHWALGAPAQPSAFPWADLRHAPPVPLALPARGTGAFADSYPARTNQHPGAALAQMRPALPSRVIAPPAALPPAASRHTGLDVAARRIARAELRIFALCALCALLLLAGAGVVLWRYPGDSSPSAARASQSHAVGQAPGAAHEATTAPAAPAAQPTPSATVPSRSGSPSPAPTHAAARTPSEPSVPSNGRVVPVVPTTTSLVLACGAPGVPLPLYNGGSVVQSWRIALPPDVAGNGWIGTLTGTVNPGYTLTLHLWQMPGSPRAPETVYVQSAGQQTAVHLSFAAC